VIGVPFARAINPITKTNREGTGVEPDVKVAAADALTTAQKLAAGKLCRGAPFSTLTLHFGDCDLPVGLGAR
jgi:hypothetical protein